ncbi:MAG TPA: energy transducer TonB, partial [Saprospiraceae bacterium]|nr:energy transducer TonB [Saprospiraceae bacterium]
MVDISIGTVTLGISVLLLMVLVVGIVIGVKRLFNKRSQGELAQKYHGRSGEAALEVRNKYPEVDVFNLSGTFFNVGLALALGVVVLAFGWTQY